MKVNASSHPSFLPSQPRLETYNVLTFQTPGGQNTQGHFTLGVHVSTCFNTVVLANTIGHATQFNNSPGKP